MSDPRDIPPDVVIAELNTQLALFRGRCFDLAGRIAELEAELDAALAARGPVIGLGQPAPPLVN